jgi:vacuolar-type H+-ATPase subunit I/STV1
MGFDPSHLYAPGRSDLCLYPECGFQRYRNKIENCPFEISDLNLGKAAFTAAFFFCGLATIPCGMFQSMNKTLKPKKKNTTPRRSKGLGRKVVDLFSAVEHLPYGASLMTEIKAAKMTVGMGVLNMAFGAVLFSIGWKGHIPWVAETAFVITLIGWMMVVLGFAFGVIGWTSKYLPFKKGGK